MQLASWFIEHEGCTEFTKMSKKNQNIFLAITLTSQKIVHIYTRYPYILKINCEIFRILHMPTLY